LFKETATTENAADYLAVKKTKMGHIA